MGQKTPPETNAERYLKRAADLRAMADAAASENVRRELLVVAQQYEKLADDVLRIHRRQ